MRTNFYALPVVFSIGLFGCNQSENQTSTTPAPVDEEHVGLDAQNHGIDDIFVSSLPDTAPTYTVATTGNMPPFSFQDEYGHLQGIDIDAMNAIGEAQGFKVHFYKEDWADLFESVNYGRRDMVASGISYSDERAEKFALSDPYYINPSAIMYIDRDLNIQGIEDLQGLRVGVLDGSKHMQQVQEMGEASVIEPNASTFLLFADLVQGDVDAIVQDQSLLQYTSYNHPEQSVVIATYEDRDSLGAQQVVLMAKDNTDLITQVNEGIAKLRSTGELAMIKGKWLSAATPATIENSISSPSAATAVSTN